MMNQDEDSDGVVPVLPSSLSSERQTDDSSSLPLMIMASESETEAKAEGVVPAVVVHEEKRKEDTTTTNTTTTSTTTNTKNTTEPSVLTVLCGCACGANCTCGENCLCSESLCRCAASAVLESLNQSTCCCPSSSSAPSSASIRAAAAAATTTTTNNINKNNNNNNNNNLRKARAELEIDGMTCSMCAQAIERCLRNLPGVLDVKVSLTTDTAIVEWQEDTGTGSSSSSPTSSSNSATATATATATTATLNEQILTQAIEDIGYDVVSVLSSSRSHRMSTGFATSLTATSTAVPLQQEQQSPQEQQQQDSSTFGTPAAAPLPTSNTNTTTTDTNTNTPTNDMNDVQARWERLQQRQQRKVQQRLNAFLLAILWALPVSILTMVLPHLMPTWSHVLETTMIPIFSARSTIAISVQALMLWILATLTQIICGWEFYKGSYYSLVRTRPIRLGMDVLVALGTTASYLYAMYGMFQNPNNNDSNDNNNHHHHPAEDTTHFFETSTTLIAFVLAGKWMQAAAVQRTSSALQHLMALQTKTAIKVIPFKDRQNFHPLHDPYKEVVVTNIQEIKTGDLVKILPGASIPADGRVLFGQVSVDESMLTGESLPVWKTPGSIVLGGTVCVESTLESSDDEEQELHEQQQAEDEFSNINLAATGAGASSATTASSTESSAFNIINSNNNRSSTTTTNNTNNDNDNNNHVGAAFVHVTGVGSATALAQIIQLVTDAQTANTAPIQNLADTIASVFVPTVTAASILTLIIWYSLCRMTHVVPEEWYQSKGESAFTFSLLFGIAVLVISCPCALGLATPTAIMVGTGVGAKLGVLIKGGQAIETAAKVSCVVFDKTGTLTKGTPVITDFFQLDDPGDLQQQLSSHPNLHHNDENKDRDHDSHLDSFSLSSVTLLRKQLLWLFASLERTSTHPLAKAVVTYAQDKVDAPLVQPTNFRALTGRGASAMVQGIPVAIGNRAFARALNLSIPRTVEECMVSLEDEGKTAILAAVNNKVCVVMGVADEVKPEAATSIAYLRERLGVDVWMVTGDNTRTAHAVGQRLGIPSSKVISEAMPATKVDYVRRLQEEGDVLCFVGDGINDSPALAQADVGMSMGTGTEIAAEASDMVLVAGNVSDVCTALDLSRCIFRRIQWNFGWSLLYNCLGIPVAAGVFYPLVHTRLPPPVAAIAMALSSISVVLSSMALRLYRPPAVLGTYTFASSHRRGSSSRLSRRSRPSSTTAWASILQQRNRRNSSSNNNNNSASRGSRWRGGGFAEPIGGRYDTDLDDSNNLSESLLENDTLFGSSDVTESTRCTDNRTITRMEYGELE